MELLNMEVCILVIGIPFALALLLSRFLLRAVSKEKEPKLLIRLGRIFAAWVSISLLCSAILLFGLPVVGPFLQKEPSIDLKRMAAFPPPLEENILLGKRKSVAIPAPILMLNGSGKMHSAHALLPKNIRANVPSEVRTLVWERMFSIPGHVGDNYGGSIIHDYSRLIVVDRATGLTLMCIQFDGIVPEAEIYSQICRLNFVDASGAPIVPHLSVFQYGLAYPIQAGFLLGVPTVLFLWLLRIWNIKGRYLCYLFWIRLRNILRAF
jgi:hypothetical protein